MSWLFNADYEGFLFSGKNEYNPISNKINQEFEYLIHFFEDKPIFTTKKYSKEYTDHVEAMTGREFRTTSSNEKVLNWWCSVGEIEQDRLLHSKLTSTKFSIQRGFESEAKIIDSSDAKLMSNMVYKLPGEFSGRGHLVYPKDAKRIKKLLAQSKCLIEEPLRNRVQDFSSLALAQDKIISYENIVDEKFQYKGTKLISPKMNEGYFKAINETVDFYLQMGATFPFSIDSYSYIDKDTVKTAAVCEVNVRKTMGYIALKLKEFFSSDLGALLIANSRKESIPDTIWLSPRENLFQLCFIAVNDKDILEDRIRHILE